MMKDNNMGTWMRHPQWRERHKSALLLSQYLFPRQVCRSKKVPGFGAMEDIRNDKYLATS